MRRKSEIQEALGPALDGHDQLARLEMFLSRDTENEEETENIGQDEPNLSVPQVVLICGTNMPALEVAALARSCGFEIELAYNEIPPELAEWETLAQQRHHVENWQNLVEVCGINRNYYICIFEPDIDVCANLLMQCLPSDAAYLGAWASMTRADEIFENLKQAGAPDAELAAVCCPMGLGIGAETPDQEAVAVVAEVLAAKSGALKRLRLTD